MRNPGPTKVDQHNHLRDNPRCQGRTSPKQPYSDGGPHGYNSHEGRSLMRSVNVAELKNQLSKYLTFAKGGEEIVIRDRNLPVAKLVPFSPEQPTEQQLLLVPAHKIPLPK